MCKEVVFKISERLIDKDLPLNYLLQQRVSEVFRINAYFLGQFHNPIWKEKLCVIFFLEE